jgi:outer membrane lipopolysaccharide assembly protein LptE/RlpB
MLRFLILVACLVSFTSCGYRFSGNEELPQGVERLFIQLLDNQTTEPGIEVVVTNELKNEFLRKYRGVLVDRETAEAILSGTVMGIRTETVARRGALTALERSVSMTIELKLKTTGNERIWFARGITRDDTYSVVSGDKEITEQNKRKALKDVAERIAEISFYRLTDYF